MKNLKSLLKEKHITQGKLGIFLGYAPSTINGWVNGNSEPDNASLEKTAQYLNVSTDYLLGRTDIRNVKASCKGIIIPVLGKIPAGIPLEAIEDIVDTEEITPEMAAQGEYFALRVEGNSMEPRIKEGDVVIIKKQPDADTGSVVVALINGYDATLKELKKEPNGIWLVPYNPACSFKPTFYSTTDIKRLPVVILGKVVELRGKFN